MIQPDANAIERARAVNRRRRLSIPAGITLDDTHLPHITMLQRYLRTADLDKAYAAIENTIAATDVAALSYHVPGITYSEHWGPPGEAAAVLGVHPYQQVRDLQAAPLAAVTPFTGTGGIDAAFVTDPGQQISATTKDWVETWVSLNADGRLADLHQAGQCDLGVELDQDSYEVRRRGHLIDLSPTEFRLLRYLMLNPGRVLTRAQLLAYVWDYDFGGSSTVVSTYVAYLRRKLAEYGPDVIHTQRGVGYSLRLPRPGEQASPDDA